MARVDLNSDLGESFGRYTLGLDEQVIPLVTSVNVACGMHAGDPVVMRRTVKLAAEAGIAVGAHPGYPDLQGFGRRNMALSPDEGYAYVLYQVGALAAFCRAEGVKLAHVKPHGQLYNRAAVDAPFAQAIAQAVADFNPDITLVALAGGELARAGKAAGLHVAQEFFADRNYTDEGTLVSRTQDNATITDEEFAVARVVRVIQEGSIESITGKTINIAADTICVHGDNAHALEFARDIRRALTEAGIEMRPAGKIHPAAWTRQTTVPRGHGPIGSLFAQQIIDRSRAVPKDEGVGRTGDLAGEIVGSELRVAVRASCEKQPGDRQAP